MLNRSVDVVVLIYKIIQDAHSTKHKKKVIVYYHYVLNRLLDDSLPVTVIETGHFHNKSLYCHNT